MRNPVKALIEDVSDLWLMFKSSWYEVDDPRSPLCQADAERRNFISDLKDTLLTSRRSELIASGCEPNEIEELMKSYDRLIEGKVTVMTARMNDEQFGPLNARNERARRKTGSVKYMVSMSVLLAFAVIGIVSCCSMLIETIFA